MAADSLGRAAADRPHARRAPAAVPAAAAVAAGVAAVAVVDPRKPDTEPDMKIAKAILPAAIAGTLISLTALAQAPAAPATPAAAKPAAAKPAASKAAKSFATAQEAAGALAGALKAANKDELFAVLGPDSRSWVLSGDDVADRADWKKFLDAYEQKNAVQVNGDKAVLEVGNDAWPFPAPIVNKGGKWAFDANAGREEVINRRVGRNELDTIQTLLAVVDAQREYAAGDMDGNGFSDYARRVRSSPGKKDGLYWPDEAGKPQSPLGPLVAEATAEGYGKGQPTGKPQAYHGYHYKLLTSQGKNAPGGAYDYVVGGKLLGGFAVLAYPANYGSSGVMTFLVNHEGVVYEKDLGASTATAAAGMTKFDPDKTWRKAQ